MLFTATDEDGEFIVIQEDRDALWDMFDSIVKICVKYIHRIRGVKLVDTGKGMRPIYSKKSFPEIRVREIARKWEIELPIPEI